jgi:hypothetical protein
MKLFLPKCAILLLAGAALFSCSKDDDAEPTPEETKLGFMKVGTSYAYYYDDGLFNADTVKTIVEKQLATDTFLVRHTSPSVAVANTQYWVVKDNNFYSSIRLRDPSTYSLECKFGQPVGTTWDVVKNKVPYTYSIEALDVTITTGDGEVKDAIKVKMRAATGQEAFQYFSPTVGLLGNGSISEKVTMKVVHYKVGTTEPVEGNTPRITYGNFSFLTVGKYWYYTESSIFGNDVDVSISIDSKTAQNIYKVKVTYDGTPSYQYWFEDNGMLMVYDEGETYLNADPIYMKESIATEGYGWGSLTTNGKFFIYKVDAVSEVADTFFGELPCMQISVTDGLFTSQVNYWNAAKGNVLVSGMVSREVLDSNARKQSRLPVMPVIAPY